MMEKPGSTPRGFTPVNEGTAIGSATEEIARLRSLLQTTEAARDDWKHEQRETEKALVALQATASELQDNREFWRQCVAALESRLSSLTQAHARLRTGIEALIQKWRYRAPCPCGSGLLPSCTSSRTMGCEKCCEHRLNNDCAPLYTGSSSEDECADDLAAVAETAKEKP